MHSVGDEFSDGGEGVGGLGSRGGLGGVRAALGALGAALGWSGGDLEDLRAALKGRGAFWAALKGRGALGGGGGLKGRGAFGGGGGLKVWGTALGGLEVGGGDAAADSGSGEGRGGRIG